MDIIRVLLLEDHEGEARLNQRLLERSYTTEYHFSGVRTLADALAAVDREDFDVALLDLNVPDSKGIDTFTAFQAAAPDIPVVIISAVADDQLALNAIHLGAQDYLIKGGITSDGLMRGVRHALARRKAEKVAGRVLPAPPPGDLPLTASFRLDADGRITRTSAGLAALLHEEDALGVLQRPLSGFFRDEDAARIDEAVRRAFRGDGGDVMVAETQSVGGEYARLLLAIHGTNMQGSADGSGEEREVCGTAVPAPGGQGADTDATRAAQRYRTLVEHSQDGVFVLAEEKIQYANRTLAAMLGYGMDELVGMEFSRLLAPEDVSRVRDNYRRRVGGEDVEENYEFAALHRDGSRVRVQLSVGRLSTDEGVEIMGTLKNVSEMHRTSYHVNLQHRLAIRLAQTRGHDEVFAELLQGLLHIESIDLSAVFLRQPSDHYAPVAWKGMRGPFPAAEEDAVFSELHDRLAHEAAPRYFGADDLAAHPLGTLLRPEGIRSYAVIPVLQGERPLACIDVASMTQDSFSEAVRRTVELIASYFGGVLARVTADDARLESEELYRAVVEKSHDAIFIFRGDRIVFANEKTAVLTGYGTDELLSLNPWTLIHPDDRARIQEIATRRASGEGAPLMYEGRVLTRDGTIRVGEFAATMIRYGGGISALVTVRDVTSRTVHEEELKHSDALIRAAGFAAARFLRSRNWEEGLVDVLERLGSAANVCRVVVFETVADGEGVRRMRQHAVWIRPEMRDSMIERVADGQSFDERPFSRWAQEFEAGRAISGIIDNLPDDEQIVLARQNVRSLAAVPVFTGEHWWGYIRFDECRLRRTWLRSEIEAMAVSAETLGAALRRTQNEREILVSREQALKADAIKNAFIANISHEVRTPLNIILGYLSLVSASCHPEENEEVREYAREIEDASARLIHTVDSVLDISRFQARDLHPRFVPLRLDKLLESCVTAQSRHAALKGLSIGFENALGAVEIPGDERFLSQSFRNLLDNAVKFTAEGSIDLTLDMDGSGHPRVRIADTGIGISQQHLEQVFQPYFQEDFGYDRSYEGIGLGLTLVKLFLEAHGAQISIHSRKNAGTAIEVVFPAAGDR